MKGAIDDLNLVIRTLEECGFPQSRFYIHCDGALFGIMLPFVKQAAQVIFEKPIGSISISGHKFLGCLMPCGIPITRKKHINALSHNVEIIASRDATISGSRNDLAPIFLWYTLMNKGYNGLKSEVQTCLNNACYLEVKLKEAGISSMLNVSSSTVVFERPQDNRFVRRWTLACQGNVAHVIVMPHVTIDILDTFINEFLNTRSNWSKDPPCVASMIGKQNCSCLLHK